jgi:hypothetical protein
MHGIGQAGAATAVLCCLVYAVSVSHCHTPLIIIVIVGRIAQVLPR